jgi:UDP-glucuronate 4-epimerase
MTILVTGSAGFIGYHVSKQLLDRGEEVIGVDNLNDYYDVSLKKARLHQLQQHPHFTFSAINIADREAIQELCKKNPGIEKIVHLAAQAGVRYSLTKPYPYIDSNVVGHLTILEACRHLDKLKHLVYASSSSVYGANQKLPFSVQDPVDTPISLYAATKRSGELMSYTYSHLYGIPTTGLRFFTVYGPWGRPDMSAFLFTKAILNNQEIAVFNHGDMRRNFTYIDDIVTGTINCLDRPPEQDASLARLYNIGNSRSESLMDFIHTLENTLQKKAKIRFEDMQPGDVKETIADISDTTRDFGFHPKTDIEEGLKAFVAWYRGFYGV